jgi:hypothetical protein
MARGAWRNPEQQAQGGVGGVIIIIAKRKGDARGRAPAPVLLLWNGIKMRIFQYHVTRKSELKHPKE